MNCRSMGIVALWIFCILIIPDSGSAQVPRVGSTPLGFSANDIVLRDTLAYLATREHGLVIVSVQDSLHPRQLAHVPIQTRTWDIELSGDLAYLAAADSGLILCDISDPLHPRRYAFCEVFGACGQIVLHGGYAYVTRGELSPAIVDVHDPAHPVFVDSIDAIETAVSLTLWEDYLFVCGSWAQDVTVFHLEDPAQPVLVSRVPFDGGLAYSVLVVGEWAYFGTWHGIQVYHMDQVDPPHLEATGRVIPFSLAVQFIRSGDIAYVRSTDWDELYQIGTLDLSDPSTPILMDRWIASSLQGGGDLKTMALSGRFLYTGYYGFSMFDVGDPAEITFLQLWAHGRQARSAAFFGDYVCVAGSAAITMIDIADPTRPAQTGSFQDMTYSVTDIAVCGGGDPVLYAAGGGDGMIAVDISNPGDLQSFQRVVYEHQVTDVEVSGHYLYVLERLTAMHILDISDPFLPVEAGVFPCMGYTMEAKSRYLHVVEQGQGLVVYDLADPVDPRRLLTIHDYSPGIPCAASDTYLAWKDPMSDSLLIRRASPEGSVAAYGFTMGGLCQSLSLSGEWLIAGYADGLVRIFDLSDSTDIHEVASFRTLDSPSSVIVRDSSLYIADNNNLGVYDGSGVAAVAERPWTPTDRSFQIAECYPNPFNSNLRIRISGTAGSGMRLTLHNVLGQEIMAIHEGPLPSGEICFTAPPGLSSGIYFITAEAGMQVESAKVLFLR